MIATRLIITHFVLYVNRGVKSCLCIVAIRFYRKSVDSEDFFFHVTRDRCFNHRRAHWLLIINYVHNHTYDVKVVFYSP
jgi:hypothetical protein